MPAPHPPLPMETSLPGTALGGQRIGKRSLVQTMLTVLTQTAGDRGDRSGRRYVFASTSAPAIINAPSVIDAMATGQGSDIAEIRATAPHPEQRRARIRAEIRLRYHRSLGFDRHFGMGASAPLMNERPALIVSSRSRNSSATRRASMLLRTSCGLINMMISERCLCTDLVPDRFPRNSMSFSPGIPSYVF